MPTGRTTSWCSAGRAALTRHLEFLSRIRSVGIALVLGAVALTAWGYDTSARTAPGPDATLAGAALLTTVPPGILWLGLVRALYDGLSCGPRIPAAVSCGVFLVLLGYMSPRLP